MPASRLSGDPMSVKTALLAVLLTSVAQAGPIVHPSVAAGFRNPAAASSPLGSNLAPVDSFRTEYPFVNHFKMATPWFSGNPTLPFDDPRRFRDGRPLRTDARGHVRSLLPDQDAKAVIFDGTPADRSLSRRRFEIFWDGQGTLEFDNAEVLHAAPGRAAIRLREVTGPRSDLVVVVRLTATNPADPLRNVRMLPPGGICARDPASAVVRAGECPGNDFVAFRDAHASIVFNPPFLAGIRKYRTLRFMDWMRTNGSGQQDFAGRARPADQFWSTPRGVPLEVMVALANLMDIDPWFNMPHRATDDYVARFATLVREQLEPGRVASIEYSNEVWNPQFAQTGFATRRGVALGLNELEGRRDDFAGMLKFYSRRSLQVFNIFESVFGGRNRLRRVMATQAANPFLTELVLGFENAAAGIDAFAIAPYFGDTITERPARDELLRLGVDGVFAWLRNDDNPTLVYGSLASVDRIVRQQMAVVSAAGLPLIAYEGGQHFVGGGEFQFDEALNTLMDALNRDPRMKGVYATYLDNWRRATGGEFTHYLHADRHGPFGRWGARETMTQPRADAPKFDALMEYVQAQPLP